MYNVVSFIFYDNEINTASNFVEPLLLNWGLTLLNHQLSSHTSPCQNTTILLTIRRLCASSMICLVSVSRAFYIARVLFASFLILFFSSLSPPRSYYSGTAVCLFSGPVLPS